MVSKSKILSKFKRSKKTVSKENKKTPSELKFQRLLIIKIWGIFIFIGMFLIFLIYLMAWIGRMK